MEPKFQSSFIPKGPASSVAPAGTFTRTGPREKSLFAFIAVIVFVLSFLLALGLFGYNFYLKYSINQMSQELNNDWTALQPEVIRELIDLDARINSTQGLISNHQIITPIFEFLETSTPVTVRYSNFNFGATDQGLTVRMTGEAKGYTALAQQADIFNKSPYFTHEIFSDFRLNEKGNVTFSFLATVDPKLISYERSVANINIPMVESGATSTPQN